MADEQMNMRIWGGIRFRNSLAIGDDVGPKIAGYLVENSVQPAG
jgi:hypothetical protein